MYLCSPRAPMMPQTNQELEDQLQKTKVFNKRKSLSLQDVLLLFLFICCLLCRRHWMLISIRISFYPQRLWSSTPSEMKRPKPSRLPTGKV